jgi:hypothetical protein
MSAPHLFAATKLSLPALAKLTALALGDLAQADGRVIASHRRLRTWTQHSEQTVRRTLRQLEERRLLDVLVEVDRRSSTPATLGLRYPGASQVGGWGGSGASQVGGQVPDRQLPRCPTGTSTIRSYVPKSIKAAPQTAPASPVEKGQKTEDPTDAQLTKLVALRMDDEHSQLGDRGEFEELVKRDCARFGFRYNSEVIDAAIRRFLAARGVDPDARDLRHASRRR